MSDVSQAQRVAWRNTAAGAAALATAFIAEQSRLLPEIVWESKGPTDFVSRVDVGAEEIIRRAQAAGVPVTEDPRLAAVLSQIDVGAIIPPELYAVVAEVLAYVYRLDDRVNRRK